MLKKNWWKILFFVTIANLINVVCHFVNGTHLPANIDPFSSISKTLGVDTVATIFLIAFYISMSITFLITEKWMNGGRTIKGLKFGMVWGIIYFLGVIETYPVFGKTSIISDIRIAIADFIPIIVLGVLLGMFLASDGQRIKTPIRNNSLILFAVTSFYILGRYFAYSILNIESGFIERPVSTFLWTLATGISFGILYILTGWNTDEKNLIRKSVLFGLTNAGPNWVVFNLFWVLIYESSVLRYVEFIFARAIVDVIFILVGVYFSEWLINKKAQMLPYKIHESV